MIRVGGATEIEVKEKKDRVDDALNATRAAVEEGIVAGGGVALLRAASSITATGDNADQEVGINIIRRALQAPIRQIAENAGVEGSIVVGKLLEQKKANWGYDAQNDEYVDMIEAGIIDPTKVVLTALKDAASIASLLITTEAGVADSPKKDLAGGGMPGYGWNGRHGRHDVSAPALTEPGRPRRTMRPLCFSGAVATKNRHADSRLNSAAINAQYNLRLLFALYSVGLAPR